MTYANLDDAITAFLENTDYDTVDPAQGVAKAKLFIQAARAIMLLRPTDSAFASERMGFSNQQIADQLAEAKAWLGGTDDASAQSAPTRADLSEFRT